MTNLCMTFLSLSFGKCKWNIDPPHSRMVPAYFNAEAWPCSVVEDHHHLQQGKQHLIVKKKKKNYSIQTFMTENVVTQQKHYYFNQDIATEFK